MPVMAGAEADVDSGHVRPVNGLSESQCRLSDFAGSSPSLTTICAPKGDPTERFCGR